MEIITIVLLVVIALGIGIAIFILLNKKPEKKDDSSMLMLQQQLSDIRQAMDSKLVESNKILQDSNKTIQTQFGQSTKLITDITERLTRLDETNKQVINYADQLKSLQDILKNPKQRGVLGEYMLETVLKNVLPPGSYQTQYEFKNGEKVDAVVFFDKKIIPVDAKFSLENYNRLSEATDPLERKRYESIFMNDLKARIDETAKYVRPEEKTMDFAFMFIPHEAVYYDLLVNKVGLITEETDNLIHFAYKKKVLIVSPTSFVAYLQTVVAGLRNQKLSEEAHLVRDRVEKLGKHLFVYSEYISRMGQNLDKTVSSFNKANSEFAKVDKDVIKIAGGESKIKLEEVEHPLLDD
jgi:DNA recombination protein RmuC